MKIGILTQPLHHSYGGLLQAFATQKVLKDLGHDALTIDREPFIMAKSPWPSLRRVLGKIFSLSPRQVLGKILHRIHKTPPAPPENASRFIRENIATTGKIATQLSARQLKKYNFDAFVVGSDQVWRREFMPCPRERFFLDFCSNDETVRRIAFAVSFGIDYWDFFPAETKKLSALAKKFHAISVREDSGVELCRKYLGVHAEHLIDPTMLLEKSDYEKIIEDDEARGFLEPRDKASHQVFSYILDVSEEKKFVEKVVFEELSRGAVLTLKKLTLGMPFSPVSAWLRDIRDSEFVVTDSFHGSVFSIIFNKPFLAIGNAKRGMARFNSLLKMFGLENRLLLVPEKPSDDLERQILDIVHTIPDWQEANARREREQKKAREFLEQALLK